MKDPKTICKEHNLWSYQAHKGAEVMARYIRDEVERIMTTPSNRTVYEQLDDFFGKRRQEARNEQEGTETIQEDDRRGRK